MLQGRIRVVRNEGRPGDQPVCPALDRTPARVPGGCPVSYARPDTA